MIWNSRRPTFLSGGPPSKARARCGSGLFIFAVWPFPGHVFPHLAVATALRKRGHTCVFYTGEKARELIESQGFEVEPFRALDEQRLLDIMLSPARGSLKPRDWRRFSLTLRGWLVDTMPGQLEDLIAIIDRRRPGRDSVDPAMWGPSLVLHESRQLPVAILAYMLECPLPGPDAPPFSVGLRAPRGRISRMANRIAHHLNRSLGGGFRREINALRAQHGLAPIPGTPTEHTGTMPLYMVPSTLSFDYHRTDLPASVHYLGACSFNRPSSANARRGSTNCPPIGHGSMPRKAPCRWATWSC